MRAHVRAFVCGGWLPRYFNCGCASEKIITLLSYTSRVRKAYYSYLTPSALARSIACRLLSYTSRVRKAYYSYLTPGAVARSVACKLHKQVLRSILAPAHSFMGSNFRLTLIEKEQVFRFWRKNGHLILVNCL